MVSLEKGAYRLSCITKNPPGKLKLVFDFGASVDHLIYGKSNNLKGEIPLFEPRESFAVSNYFDLDKEEQEKLLEDSITRLRYLFDNLDEDELKKVFHAIIVLTILCFPRLDVKSKLFTVAVNISAGGYMADDWVDDMDDFLGDVTAANRLLMRKLNIDWKSFSVSQTEREKFFNEVSATMPGCEKFTTLNLDTMSRLHEQFPKGFPLELKYAWAQFVLSAQSITCAYKSDDLLAFSEETHKTIRRYDAGFGPCADFAAVLHGITIPKMIRKSLLFKLLSDGLMDFSGLINDILGVIKDIKKDAAGENHVLRRVIREGISLEKSFGEAIKRLKDLTFDIGVIMQRLLDAFPEDKELSAYIQACKDFCDGETVGYCCALQNEFRYGSITIDIVPV